MKPGLTLSGSWNRTPAGPGLFQAFVPAAALASLACIDPARREDRRLVGFQRGRIPAHIDAIADYLRQPFAFLPNPLILGLVDRDAFSLSISLADPGLAALHLEARDGPPALIIDGQQRFHAIAKATFTGIVPIMLVTDLSSDQMLDTFIRVNTVHPLPKSLLFEVLTTMPAPPPHLDRRAIAATIAGRLANDLDSPLFGRIGSSTQDGPIADLPLQTALMHQLEHGALALHADPITVGLPALKRFFEAVRATFPDAFDGHTARTSRLLHGAGIRALLRTMSEIERLTGSSDRATFEAYLSAIKPRTAWTSGTWAFPDGPMAWNQIQNLHADQRKLTSFLLELVYEHHGHRAAA